jgi:hypothetical protein
VIEYETYEDMETALRKLDDADLKGNRVRVIEVYLLISSILFQQERHRQARSPDRRGYGHRGRSYDRNPAPERGYQENYRRDDDYRRGGRSSDQYPPPPRYNDRRSRSREWGGDRDAPRRSRDRYAPQRSRDRDAPRRSMDRDYRR